MQLREAFIALGHRMADAGWRFHSPDVVRPEELRHHDEEAVARTEELLGRPLPPFVRNFALEVGMVCLLGVPEEGSELARALPEGSSDSQLAALAPLVTVPLPNALAELEEAIDEELEDLGIPVIEDPFQAAGMSGGPPLCVLFDPDAPSATALFADLDPEEPLGIDFEAYVQRCLRNGGVFTLPEAPAAAQLLRRLSPI